MEIAMGHGDVEVATVVRDGRHGLLLQKLEKKHPVGLIAGSAGEEYTISDEDVVIWFDSEEGGRVLQDGVHMTIMQLLGIE